MYIYIVIRCMNNNKSVDIEWLMEVSYGQMKKREIGPI